MTHDYLTPLPITIRARRSYRRARRAVGLCEECLFGAVFARSPLSGSEKDILNVSVGMDEHVNRSLAAEEDCTNQPRPMSPHTKGSAVHLTCRSWRRSLRFNYSFLLFLTRSHQSASQRGAERSQRSLHPGSAAATRSSGLQKNCDSLWHMLRCSIISLSLPCALPCSLALVRSVFTGTCKITWQAQLKALDRTDVPQRPANFYKLFSFIKMRSSVKSGSASASQRVSYY